MTDKNEAGSLLVFPQSFRDTEFYSSRENAFDLFKSQEEKYFHKIIPDYLSKGWTDGDKASAEAVADAKYMRLSSGGLQSGE